MTKYIFNQSLNCHSIKPIEKISSHPSNKNLVVLYADDVAFLQELFLCWQDGSQFVFYSLFTRLDIHMDNFLDFTLGPHPVGPGKVWDLTLCSLEAQPILHERLCVHREYFSQVFVAFKTTFAPQFGWFGTVVLIVLLNQMDSVDTWWKVMSFTWILQFILLLAKRALDWTLRGNFGTLLLKDPGWELLTRRTNFLVQYFCCLIQLWCS